MKMTLGVPLSDAPLSWPSPACIFWWGSVGPTLRAGLTSPTLSSPTHPSPTRVSQYLCLVCVEWRAPSFFHQGLSSLTVPPSRNICSCPLHPAEPHSPLMTHICISSIPEAFRNPLAWQSGQLTLTLTAYSFSTSPHVVAYIISFVIFNYLSFSIDQCLSTYGELAPKRHLATSGDRFGCHKWWVVFLVRDIATCPVIYKIGPLPTKNFLFQNVHNAMVRNPTTHRWAWHR